MRGTVADKLYMVLALKEVFEAELCGGTIELPISEIDKGCVGCALIFDSQDAAENYADGKYKVMA